LIDEIIFARAETGWMQERYLNRSWTDERSIYYL